MNSSFITSRPDLDPNCLTLSWYSQMIFLNVNFEKNNQQTSKEHAKLPSMQRVKRLFEAAHDKRQNDTYRYHLYVKFLFKLASIAS